MSAISLLTGATAGANILEGIFGMTAADAQAASLRDQARLLKVESEADIARYAESAGEFKKKQAMAFMKSGVSLEGSPLDILDETVRVSSENISAMRAQTVAKQMELKSKASAVRGAGRAALVSGFGKAASVYIKQETRLPTLPSGVQKSVTGFNETNFDERSFK